MKKIRIRNLLIILIVGSLFLTACSDSSPAKAPPTPAQEGLPFPSTPGPALPTPTPTDPPPIPDEPSLPYTVPALPTTSGPLSTPLAPILQGSPPTLTNLPVPYSTPLTARLLAEIKGQGKTAEGQPAPILALALSPDGKLLALAERSQIWLLEIATGKLTQRLLSGAANEDERGAHSLAWSADSKLLAAGGLSGIISVWRWEAANNRFRAGPQRLSSTPTAEAFGDSVEVAFSPDNKYLAGFGSDGYITVYRTDSGARQAVFQSEYAGYLSWSPDSKRLADEFFLLHSITSNATTLPDEAVAIGADGPQGIGWSPDGTLLAASGDAFELLLVAAPRPGQAEGPNPSAAKILARVPVRSAGPQNPSSSSGPQAQSMPHLKEGRRVAWTPDSRWVAAANVPEAGKISLWDKAGQPVLTFEASSGILRTLVWPREGLLVSAGNDGVVRLWQLVGPPAPLIGGYIGTPSSPPTTTATPAPGS